MCDNVVQIIGATMTEIEPEILDVEDALGDQDTPEGIAALAAYQALSNDLATWKPGDAAQDVIQAIGDLNTGLQDIGSTVGIPAPVLAMIGVISAALAIILGVVEGNSTTNTKERKQIAARTVAAVKKFVPSFEESRWVELRAATVDPGAVAGEVRSHWNKVIAAAVEFYPQYAKYKR